MAAYWAIPPLISLLLYWPGLTAWFQKDEFVSLNLYNTVHTWKDFVWVTFTPFAPGTSRVISERLFFLSFYSLFGMNAFPSAVLHF